MVDAVARDRTWLIIVVSAKQRATAPFKELGIAKNHDEAGRET
jgi:hypothetical protein